MAREALRVRLHSVCRRSARPRGRWRGAQTPRAALRARRLLPTKRLLSDQRKGMDTATVERKLFLMLNKRMWEANPGVHLPC
jgi:hypothetical protein